MERPYIEVNEPNGTATIYLEKPVMGIGEIEFRGYLNNGDFHYIMDNASIQEDSVNDSLPFDALKNLTSRLSGQPVTLIDKLSIIDGLCWQEHLAKMMVDMQSSIQGYQKKKDSQKKS